MKQDHLNDRKIILVNRFLFLILSGLLVGVYVTYGHSSRVSREVRHQLGAKLVVERCVTCHDPTRHKTVKGHKPFAEACTTCHNGMGRGITQETAHADSRTGEENLDALFPLGMVSTGCLRCHHPRMLPQNAPAFQGWKLFMGKGCGSCHQIRGISAGAKGPDLSRVGDHFTVQALESKIRTPQFPGYYSIMPTFRLKAAELNDLAAFLKGQSMSHVRPPDNTSSPHEPSNPLERYNCVSCHSYRGRDGMVGPDLNGTHAQRNEKWLKAFLKNVLSQRPSSRMPDQTDEKGVAEVTAALLTSQQKRKIPSTSAERYEFFCSRCHGKSGDGNGPIAPNLITSPRRFANNPGWFMLMPRNRLVESITNGIAGASMPPFGNLMSKEDTLQLLDFIGGKFAQIPSNALPLTDIAVPPQTSANTDIRQTYLRLCAHCHGERGERSIRFVHAKNPQPRNFRNGIYMESIADNQLYRAIARGVPGTRMKAYGTAVPGSGVKNKIKLSDGEIWQLVKHVRRLSLDGN